MNNDNEKSTRVSGFNERNIKELWNDKSSKVRTNETAQNFKDFVFEFSESFSDGNPLSYIQVFLSREWKELFTSNFSYEDWGVSYRATGGNKETCGKWDTYLMHRAVEKK